MEYYFVNLSFTENDNNIVICIIDNGPGFKPEQINQPFSQLSTTKETGTGLGLYTAQRIISANKGSISFQNQANSGAEVTIKLPSLVHSIKE